MYLTLSKNIKSYNKIIFLYSILFCSILISSICIAETYVCAHRGDVKNAPENTIPAFESAIKKGVHMIEFDVRMTKDGHLVIIHDEKVDRTTNGTGRCRKMV